MTRLWSTNINTRRDVRLALFLIASLGLAIVGACGDRISNHGHIINENELKDINIGTTTKAELLDILGRPSFTGAFNTQKLFYSSLVMVQPIASTKQIQKRIVYIFSFNDKNKLQSIDVIDKEDGFQIAHIDDKTPTPGDTLGILDQIFSNLKRQQAKE